MAGRPRILQSRGFYGARAGRSRSQGIPSTERIRSTPPGRPHNYEPSYQPNESLFDLPSVRTYEEEENSWALSPASSSAGHSPEQHTCTPLQGSSVYNVRMSDTRANHDSNVESSPQVMTLLQEQQGLLMNLLSQQQGMQQRQDELHRKVSSMEQELAKMSREAPSSLDNSKRKFRVTRDLTVSVG